MTRTAKNILHRIGRRGIFLLFLAVLDYISAYSYFFPTQYALKGPIYIFLAEVMPLWCWGILWALIGTFCLVFAFRVKDAMGYAAAAFLKGLWATMFLVAWIFADVERAYLAVTIWGMFLAVTLLIGTWPDDWKHE